ncbi:MAG: glycosyltransferase family 2 protein [Pseudomonadota bacterium]
MFNKSPPLWPRDQRRILKALRQHHAPLRIMLKTRNDPYFLEDWHRHHAAIVGPENLVIADNMSNDPLVCRLLAQLARVSTVFRFDAFHDELHKRDRFKDLYAVLEETCDWSILLDTDERLIWIEEGHWSAGQDLPDRLTALAAGAPALPGLLIENHLGQRTHFDFPANPDRLSRVLHWGKPAIASGHGLTVTGPQCHNIQFPAAMFDAGVPPRLIALHLCNLLPEQRLRANREKLAARGLCSPQTPYADIAHLDVRQETRSVIRRCVLETRRLLASASSEAIAVPPKAMVMQPDGQITFSDADIGRTFEFAQTQGAAILRAALN